MSRLDCGILLRSALRGRHDLSRQVRPILNLGLDLVFPPQCLLCRSDLPFNREHLFCGKCEPQLVDLESHRCPVCARRGPVWLETRGDCPNCRRYPPQIDRTLCLGDYHGLLREVVIRGKRAQNEAWVMAAGKLLGNAIARRGFAISVQTVIPMPTHRSRRIQRWYNAAELLAGEVARSNRLDLQRNVLKYNRSTRKQGTLSRHQRIKNVHRSMSMVGRRKLTGLNVLLIDDVMTSGATANEAARVCKVAGAREVHVAVIARGAGVG